MRNYRALLALFAVVHCAPAWATKPSPVVPARGDVVVEVLPRGYRAASGAARTPTRSATLATVQSLHQAAQRTGDARLAARAEAVLGSLPAAERGTTNGLLLGAMLAQHRHDFPTALRLLEQTIRAEPLNTSARLTRAQIHLVQGRIVDARRDCASLLLRDTGAGSVCVAAIALRTGRYADARRLADRALATPALEASLRRHLLVTRGEIASRSGEPADQWFELALSQDPYDVRTLAAYAAHLRRVRQPGKALALLAGKATTETLQLHRALAARETRSAEAAALTAMLARRYALSRALGSEPELRDEAELSLAQGDARRALRLALENFATQRDHEDIDLVVRAARAAGEPGALAPVREWAKREGLQLEDSR